MEDRIFALRKFINDAINNREISQLEISRKADVQQSTLSRFLKNEDIPNVSASFFLKLTDFFHKNNTVPTIKRLGAFSPVESLADSKNFSPISIYAVAGAGNSWQICESEPITVIHVPKNYSMQVDFAFLVDGDSMYPTMKSGAVVGINEKFDFQTNEVYAIRMPYEGIAIKRISINHERKTYIVRSDNHDQTKYPPVEISINENPNFLIGRVVWVWQNV